jgi:hypothetical protein
MGRKSDNAKKFIVSCRVNDTEMDQLQCLAREHGASVSELLRKSLILLQGNTQLNA